MITPDLVNGVFELFGSVLIWMSIRKIMVDKCSRGVSVIHISFFSCWGFWNLFYYPHLDQWISFVGGISIVVANTIWAVLMFKYRRN